MKTARSGSRFVIGGLIGGSRLAVDVERVPRIARIAGEMLQ